ncbi:MAG TPA: arsenate reductase ArsC [Candidatus Methanofastidiosa archaeon]|nr:arsenate reductase ArsC [Candidatus Methanofastidiosa archaeon]HPR42287.1 arsenate reductase ArsC [Candidatus Methanofastidiosa archaeon]
MKVSVLFVCTHNSARSQMAEELLRIHGGDRFDPESAGYEPGDSVSPLVVEVMGEMGVDIGKKRPRDVFKIFEDGAKYDYVITVCKECLENGCPILPSEKEFLRWGFDDPEALEGTYEEKIEGTRKIKKDIEKRVLEFIGYASDKGKITL